MKLYVTLIFALLLSICAKEVSVMMHCGGDSFHLDVIGDIEGEQESEKESEDIKEKTEKINQGVLTTLWFETKNRENKLYVLLKNNIAHREIVDPPPELS